MHYEVPGVTLIQQDKNMACWFASAMMVRDWAERFRPNPFANQSFGLDQKTMALYQANNGLTNAQILPLAQRLGLKPIPPMSPSIQGLNTWLTTYGPLWTNGVKHIVVIAGLKGDATRGYQVKVYDPWPGIGIEWRSLSGWYAGFDPNNSRSASTRDTSAGVNAVFLHA